MRTPRTRVLMALAAAALAAGIVAAPVAAAAPIHSSWSDTYTVQHECGVVETTTMTAREKAFFDGNVWVRSRIHFAFDGVFTGPSGATYASVSHQNGTFTPEIGRTSGQGAFLRGAGGVLFMDTGHLVFELETGATIKASAQAVRWDDPAYPGNLEAALCAKLG